MEIAPHVNGRRVVAGGLTLVLAGAAFGATACSSEESPKYSSQVTNSEPFENFYKPSITVTGFGKALTDGAIGVQPGTPIVVKAQAGRLTDVDLPTSEGKPLAGKYNAARTEWVSSETLGYGEKYTIKASVIGMAGESKVTRSFTTESASTFTAAYLTVNPGEVTGVGQPVVVRFDEPITDRAAAERAVRVTTSNNTPGGFYWASDSELHWRPKKFWEPGTKVDVKVNIAGLDLGNGTFGQQNVSTNFTIGDRVVSIADNKDKLVKVYKNGKLVRTMPTSMGSDANPTPNGYYYVTERLPQVIMDSSTFGVPVNSPGGYRTPVDFATRISTDGIFVHSAPWSVWAQGNTNTSHGCLNVSPENAQWFMNFSKPGDVVQVLNTIGGIQSWQDGQGDWNYPADKLTPAPE